MTSLKRKRSIDASLAARVDLHSKRDLALNRREFLVCCGAAATAASATSSAGQAVPGPHTEVRRRHGKPTFFVDGQPYTKPVFETYVPETRFFRQFAAAGTDVFSFSTNLGRGFGPPAWLGPETWDFKALDQRARRVLEANPQALLMPRIYCTTPDWWTAAHRDQCQVLANGSQTYSQGKGFHRDGQAFPSLASEQWRADTAAALQHVVRHMQESDYGARLFGYIITGLMSEEWYHWSIHTGELSDYSALAVRAFRAWLRAKYGTTQALRAAWNDPHAEFDAAAVPSQEARQRGRQRTFRDPAQEMPVIDWYGFYNDLVPDTIDRLCRAAKGACDFQKVVGAFYCYMFEFGGDPEFGHNAMGKLLRSPHLDFAAVTASYHDRDLGRGADYARAPITSVGLHGKLWYHDNDTVSFRYDAMHAADRDRATIARHRKELGVTANAQETIWLYRRSAGFVLGGGIFESFFDLHGGYFDGPELMAEVKRLNGVLGAAKDRDCTSVAEILMVSDEASNAYAAFESGFLQQTLRPAQVQLAKLGAPHDSILVDDLKLVAMDRYKLVIFLNCFHLDNAQRELIRRTALSGRRTVLWCYAPGYFNGATRSIEALRELTGMRIVTAATSPRVRARMDLRRGSHPIVDDFLRSGSGPIGHEHVWVQAAAVDDPTATALGVRQGSQEVALALKSMGSWTSVYTLNPVLPAALLRAMARYAGVHIYNDQDDTLYASRSYLTINADGAGSRTLCFPRSFDIGDPFTGRQLARKTAHFTCALRDKETLLLSLERANP